MKEILLKNNKKATIRKAHARDAQDIINYLNKIGWEGDFLTFGENEFNISIENEDNFKAINLYKKFNFEVEGSFKNDVCINDVYYDTISMGLLL